MKTIIINSRKFDGKIYRSWKTKLVEQKDSLLILVGEFEQEIKHAHLGVIRRGTVSYEYYWFDRWYNIFRFHNPNGELRNFYCNLNLPPKFENGVLDYVDLDIDVLVWKDFSFEILDLDEFQENARNFNYPPDLIKKTGANLAKLIYRIKNRKFPFDFET
ncbi:MAG: DUF402 domain-containing protein [Acidobacteriota bacterium]|nr:DUF402 domain-containing protein [Acidobacteriota bacterium]